MGFTIENGFLRIYREENGVTEVVIPEGVTKIGARSFEDCENITSVKIPDSVIEIRYNAFSGCTSLASINIPDSVTAIGEWAFSGCTSLKSVKIPKSMTKISWYTFEGCTSLTSVTIPDSVTEIEEKVFEGTPWLEDLCKNNNGFAIVNHILMKYIEVDGVTDVVIPEGVTEIDGSTFKDCTSITSVTIPDSVTKIGYWAFWDCIGLTSVTIPKSVTEISKFAFENCRNIKKIITKDFEIKVNHDRQIHRQIHLVVLKDLSEKIPGKIKYDIIWQMLAQKPDDEGILGYIKKNFTKMLKFAIKNNDVETISAVCKRKDLLTKKNIDGFIEYAIQHTRNGGTVEIQALLMRYKNENIGFSERKFSI